MSRKVAWFCMKCWQEGEATVESYEEAPTVAEMAPVRKQHTEILKGVIGGAKCKGDLRSPERSTRPRVKRDTPPYLPEPDAEPITLR